MKFKEAILHCHVRSGIIRINDYTKVYTEEDLTTSHEALRHLDAHKVGKLVPKVYWKNHPVPLVDRVPIEDQQYDDWVEYDPRDQPECSAFDEHPA